MGLRGQLAAYLHRQRAVGLEVFEDVRMQEAIDIALKEPSEDLVGCIGLIVSAMM